MPKTLQTSTHIGERPPGHELYRTTSTEWIAAAYTVVARRATRGTTLLAGRIPNASSMSTVAEAIALNPPELLARGKRHP
jgi:hypothetical protein